MYLTEEKILQHGHYSPHRGKIKNPTSSATLENPLCGDKVRIDVKIDKDRILDIAFSGEGCLISQAATSLLVGEVKRVKNIAKIKKFNQRKMLKLLRFKPTLSRMQCAQLCLQVLQRSLYGKN